MIINILVATVISYLIISIFKKDLLLSRYEKYNFKGNKASLLAGGLLLYFLYLLSLENLDNMNFGVVIISFIFGVPIAHLLHIQNPDSLIPQTIQYRKITTSNLILYGILGVFVGFIIGMLALSIGQILGLSIYMACIFAIIIFIVTIVKVAKWGARTPFGGYDLLGMAKKEDEEKIKNILCDNNIPYLTKPILRKEFLDSKSFKKYNRDNKILIPNNDNELIKILINEGYYDKAEDLLGNLLDTDSVWYL